MKRRRRWQAYHHDQAPRLSVKECAAWNAMARLLPDPTDRADFRTVLRSILGDLQGPTAPVRALTQDSEATSAPPAPLSNGEELGFHGMRSHGPADLAPDPFAGAYRARAALECAGAELRGFVEIPLESARGLISAVTQVPATRLGASDLLSTVEEGILGFFFERIAARLAEQMESLSPLTPFRLLRFVSELSEPDFGPEGAAGWYALVGQLWLARTAVPYRLLIPWAALESLRRRSAAAGAGSGDQTDRFLRRYSRIATTFYARVGTVPLTAEELGRIEPTDILLFDCEGFSFADGAASGRIQLARRNEDGGRIIGRIEEDGESFRMRVEEILPPDARKQTTHSEGGEQRVDLSHEESEEGSAGGTGNEAESDPNGASPATESTEGEGRVLVDATPVTLRVEIGRRRFSLRELAELRIGSIVELEKDPTAPVQLVVEDRVVGRGELVRIEDELGVRVLELE